MNKKPPLTKEKSRWAKNRDVTLRGQDLTYNASQQQKYNKALQDLIKQMTAETKKEITKLFNGSVADDYFEQQAEASSLDESITNKAKKTMNRLTLKFQLLFSQSAKPLADKMVATTSKISESNLQASLKKLSGGLTLKTGIVPPGMEDVSSAIVNENVSLIKSIPQKYFTDVTGSVMRSITTGAGLKDLLPEIQKYQGSTQRRAKLLALDQTRKAYNFINKQRLQAIGVKQFEWRHSGGGQHPRRSHIALSGKIFSFDALPIINQEQIDKGYESPVCGIPGQAINCRCTMNPVIDFDSMGRE